MPLSQPGLTGGAGIVRFFTCPAYALVGVYTHKAERVGYSQAVDPDGQGWEAAGRWRTRPAAWRPISATVTRPHRNAGGLPIRST